jgi:hypothetical protein
MNFLSASTPLKLGFLTVLEEPSGYLGGYLVTNVWGRPLEFRLSTPVQPSRVQQILYGDTMRPYVCADLIGKTLIEKTATEAKIIITDCRQVLDLRRLIEIPVVWLATSGDHSIPHSARGRGVRGKGALEIGEASESDSPPDCADMDAPVTSLPVGNLYCHPQFGADKPAVCRLIERLPDAFDLAEPFIRISEAMGEARKMSVTNRT